MIETLRRWTCGLWRYLRGYHRHPEHKRARGDSDDLWLPETGDYRTEPVAFMEYDALAAEATRRNRLADPSRLSTFSGLLDRPYQETDEPQRLAWREPAVIDRWLKLAPLADAWWIRTRSVSCAAA